AKENLRKAIQICSALKINASFNFYGKLALIFAEENNRDEAHSLLTTGESFVVDHPVEHVVFMCQMATVYHTLAQTEEAQTTLGKAISLAEKSTLHANLHTHIEQTKTVLSVTKEPDKKERQRRIDQAKRFLEAGHIEEAESLYDKAMIFYTKAMNIFEKENVPEGKIEVILAIGSIQFKLGENSKALERLQFALKISKAAELPRLQTKIYMHIGNAYENLSRYDQSIVAYKEALERSQRFGDRMVEGKVLGYLGNIHLYKMEYPMCLEYYQKAIHIAKETGNRSSEQTNTVNLGQIYQLLGQYDEAKLQYEHSVRISIEIGHKRGEGSTYGKLGLLYIERGKYDAAMECLQKGIRTLNDIGNLQDVCIQIGNLGLLHEIQGEYTKALEQYQNALSHSKMMEDRRNEGVYYGNVGNVLYKLNRFVEAKIALEKAIEICNSIFPVASAAFLATLSLLYAKEGNIEKALSMSSNLEDLLQIYPLEHGKLMCKKARIFHLAQQEEHAMKALRKAENIAETLNATPHSELGKLITETRALFPSHRSGKTPSF
ncbi:MAG: tetratricopeptide repeat protein, partial [Myxococcota bacterium]|nr:tetratricopeptide repeat protein [Myxococcota bacterium]